MTIYLWGIPLPTGGGNVERLHTALLWCKMGLDVTCLVPKVCWCRNPVPEFNAGSPDIQLMDEAGVQFVVCEPGQMRSVPGLAGSIVVEFCSPHIACVWPELHSLGVKLVHSPTMAFVSEYERGMVRHAPPAALHCQSKYQHGTIGEFWSSKGVKNQAVINGAFDVGQFPWNPLPRSQHFYVGRLARPHRSKWHPRLFEIIQRIRDHGVDAYLLAQAWNYDLTVHCGNPPQFAQCTEKDTLTSRDFMAQCHALLCQNWSVTENWPRVGLEAMASGVPLVVDQAGGWEDMVQDGHSGFLCDSIIQFANSLYKLAVNEELRQYIIHNAYNNLAYLCDPERLGSEWKVLFESL